MPFYEWKCKNPSCDHVFETLQSMRELDPLCPKCKSKVRRLISKTSFQLKGDGWYKDHYGLKKGGNNDPK